MRISSIPLHLRRLLLGTTALTGLALAASPAAEAGQGLPTGGTVAAGSATIAQTAANHLSVTTGGPRTVIDWQSFSIANGNKVTIQQPGTNSLTVNEVVGASPSQIFGDLSSNGRIVLANPNGIWFGPNSHVDVAGLVASTATMTSQSLKTFAAGGRLALDNPGSATASIVNDGHITIANQGLGAFVAPGVRNSGVIEATLGQVTLAAGTTSTLDFYGDGLVSLAVTSPVTALAVGPDGKPFKAAVENTGTLSANGGHVLVTADVVKGVVDNVINMSGVTEAKGVTVAGGDIVLDGGDGAVTVAGTLDASAAKAGQTGGSVAVTGGTVTLAATAKVDASGAAGGGKVQIGGGPHGGGTVRHAQSTLVMAGASIKADATRNGDGGTVSVWSDQATRFDGTISAQGAGTGNGGWVETSSEGALGVGPDASVSLTAPGGKPGTWLLDPFDITVSSTGGSSYDPVVDGNLGDTSVLTITPSSIESVTSGTVTLAASHNLSVTSDINMSQGVGLTLIGESQVSISAHVTLTGAFSAQTGIDGSFNLFSSGGILSSNTVTIFTDGSNPNSASTTLGSTIQIGGMISANGIYIKAADQTVNQGGTITLQSTGSLLNNEGGVFSGPSQADVILYSGTGGQINLQSGAQISATSGNIALVADTLTIADSPASITTPGTVILAPASTAGLLSGGTGYVDSVSGSQALLTGTLPGGVTEASIGVGTGAGTYAVPQSTIDALNGSGSTVIGQLPATGIGQLQVGLPGMASATTVGSANLPLATTLYGGTLDANGTVFASSTVNLVANAIGIDAGADLNVPGVFTAQIGDGGSFTQAFGSTIDGAGNVVIYGGGTTTAASITLGGTIQGAGIYVETAEPGLHLPGTITVQNGAVLTNTETEVVSGPDQADLVLYAGQGGTINFDYGAQLQASSGNIALITDNFAVTGTPGSALISAPGSVILSPATTDATMSGGPGFIQPGRGDGLIVDGTTGAAPPVLGIGTVPSGGTGLSFDGPTVQLLSSSLVAQLQIGLPGTTSDVMLGDTTGGTSFAGPAIIYGHDITLTSGAAGGPSTVTSPANLTLIADGAFSANNSSSLSVGSLTVDSGSPVTIAANASLAASGLIDIGFADGQSFTQVAGSSITSLTGVRIFDNGTGAGTIDLGGGITAPVIYAMASPVGGSAGGTVIVEATAALHSNEIGASTDPGSANLILYAGPGGGITLNPGFSIADDSGNIALISDTLTVNSSATPSVVTTPGRVILSPASTDGTLAGDPSVALPNLSPGDSLLNFAVPGGGALASIGVGTGSGSYQVSQAVLDVFDASTIGRLQIGVQNSNVAATFDGSISFPAETETFAGTIDIASSAALSLPPGTASNFGGSSAPAGLLFDANSLAFGGRIQTDNGMVAMNAPVTVTGSNALIDTDVSGSPTGGGVVSFSSSIDGPGSLTINAGATNLSLVGVPIGVNTPLANLTLTAGTVEVGSISTTGVQSYGGSVNLSGSYNASGFAATGPVSLVGDTSISAGAGGIAFGSTVDGGQNLTLNDTAGAISIAGAVGAGTPLTTLAIFGGSISLGSVTTTSGQNYSGNVIIAGNDTFTSTGGSTIDFAGTIDGASAGGQSLTISGGVLLDGETIGGSTALGSFSVTGSATVRDVVSITTTGSGITFGGTLDDAASRSGALILSAGGGDIDFNGVVGGRSTLGDVTIASARNVTGPAVLQSFLDNDDQEFSARSFTAGSVSAPLSGAFNMPGGITTNLSPNQTAGTTAGSVFIDAAGAVTIGTLDAANPGNDLGVFARGTDVNGTGSGLVAGNGGSITIIGSSVTAAAVSVRGGQTGSGSAADAAGGNAGTIVLTATNGNVDILGGGNDVGIAAYGGASTLATGTGAGGHGGTVTLTASGAVIVPSVNADGGQAVGGPGGDGGAVTIDASTISLFRVRARGGDTAATGAVAGASAGGSVTLVATGSGGNVITLIGNNSDLSGAANAIVYTTLTVSGGSTGVTDPLNTDTGGTIVGAGGTLVIEGSTSGAPLLGTIALVNGSTGGATGPDTVVAGGSNVVIATGGSSGNGGSVTILGSIVAADPGVENLRISAKNGTATVSGSVGDVNGNALQSLVLSGNGGAITVNGAVASNAVVEQRTSGSLAISGTLATSSISTPVDNTVQLDLSSLFAASGGHLALSGSYFLTDGGNFGSDSLVLTGTTVIDTSAGNGALTIGSIDGAFGLTLNAGTGSVTFGSIGANTALSSLAINAGSISLGSVTTTGAQAYTGAMTVGGTYTANGFSTNGPLVMASNTTIDGGVGDIVLGGTVSGRFGLSLVSSGANVFFDGSVGTTASRVSALSIAGAENATVENNSSLEVDRFTATNIAGTINFGDHSLESDDIVAIQATSVEGRIITTSSATIDADTVNGTIQGSSVSVTASGAVNAAVTGGDVNILGDSFSGSVQATRSANIAANGDVAANISVSGGGASLSGTDISGSLTSSGLAQIAATRGLSDNVTAGGGIDIVSPNAAITGTYIATGGSGISMVARSVDGNIIAEDGGSVAIVASQFIIGHVAGGDVSLTAPFIDVNIVATSATINADFALLTGTIGGADARAFGFATDVTQVVQGSTNQVASNDDYVDVNLSGPSDDDDRKKRRSTDPVYDFANQYIDSLIAGKTVR